MPLFSRGNPKNPQELVKGLKETLTVLEQCESGAKKAEKVVLLMMLSRMLYYDQ